MMAGCLLDGGPEACVQNVAQDALTALAEAFAKSATWAVKNGTTAWMGVDSPDVTSASSAAGWLSGRLAWFVLAVAFVSVLWAAYRMATSGSFEHLTDLGWSLGRLLVVAGTVTTATALALQVGDAVAAWVLDVGDVRFDSVAAFVATSPALAILIAFVVCVAQLVQVAIMLAKNVMVVLLVGFLPLTAAATNTPLGRAGFHKALTWLGAFVLYKPVAAVIYAVSFKLLDRGQDFTGQVSGVVLMVLAIIALPALMKFLVPAVAAVSGGNAGAVAGAAVGAGLATGAVVALGASTGGAGFAAAPAAMQAAPTGAAMGGAPAAAAGSTTNSTDDDRGTAT